MPAIYPGNELFSWKSANVVGSLCELETQLLLAQRLDYLNSETTKHLLINAAEVGRLVNGLTRYLTDQLTTDH
jgi:four helix bundle protein